jgi:hypothetical protein
VTAAGGPSGGCGQCSGTHFEGCCLRSVWDKDGISTPGEAPDRMAEDPRQKHASGGALSRGSS